MWKTYKKYEENSQNENIGNKLKIIVIMYVIATLKSIIPTIEESLIHVKEFPILVLYNQ